MKLLKTVLAATFCTAAALAMAAECTDLPAPSQDMKAPLIQAVKDRKSTRAYSNEPISQQQLADILWFAGGVNRPDGRLTTPTAMNKQEITIYAITPQGAYKYLPAKHALEKVSDKDLRAAVAGPQKFVETAPLALVYTAKMDAFPPGERSTLMYGVDAGHASQNVLLFCSANDLACVPRMTMDVEALVKELGLQGAEKPVFNNVIGHPAK